MSIPRPEHPRPHLVRLPWLNLNGEWQFTFDRGRSGRARGLPNAGKLDKSIIVPFCPESELSGIGYRDFMHAVWYRRSFTLPPEWDGTRVLLHFGAVDYDAEVWVNGRSVGKHRGGFSSFCFEITSYLRAGENAIVVCAEDETRSDLQPSGKQSPEFESYGTMYTRTTGIWQTVWVEAVPSSYIAGVRITPDLENACVHVQTMIDGTVEGLRLVARARLGGNVAGESRVRVAGDLALWTLAIDPSCVRAWSPEDPALYDLDLELDSDGKTIDRVTSYFGLRSLGTRGSALLLNGRPRFHRLVLDQGFYPDGVYTAPSDEALRKDIEIALDMGFNGARLHQKVFEERFLYWADRLGYMVWGEMGSWGFDPANPLALERFRTEWMETLARDYNHPSIVGWCPFNETQPDQNSEVLRQTYRLTKLLDPTRPCIDTSGWVHGGLTDVYDIHDYEQDPATFASHYRDELPPASRIHPWLRPRSEAPPSHEPYFVSEYGGIWWNPGQRDDKPWGYGSRPASVQEFLDRYRGLTSYLLNDPRMCGFCYTQLADVEQEVNGLYTSHRKPKFDPAVIRSINTLPAAIERGSME